MTISPRRLLVLTLCLTGLAFAGHARAESPETVPEADNSLANNLLPLETRSVGIEPDAGIFQSVTNDINNNNRSASENSENTDVLGAGFLEDLVDEDGNVELPLGITVFEAMGTTSVGFGGDF